MEAKILSIKEEDSIQRKNLMHEGPVLGISICPHDKFCCTSSGDGFCRIWNIEDQTLIKEINCLPKVNSFYSAKVLG